MEAGSSHTALSSLCKEVERAVRAHQQAGVRAVILMVDEPSTQTLAKPEPADTPIPVYVDVFESGYSQESPGYGHGV
jgi:hypothetical protein